MTEPIDVATAEILANPSPQVQTVLKWIDGFNHWDINEVLSVATDDYSHMVLPKSLGREPRSKEEFRRYFQPFLGMFRDFAVTPHEIIESPGRVFVHASSTATSTTGHDYANEYNLTFHVISRGDGPPMVSSVKEFVDSKYSTEFFAAEFERQAQIPKAD